MQTFASKICCLSHIKWPSSPIHIPDMDSFSKWDKVGCAPSSLVPATAGWAEGRSRPRTTALCSKRAVWQQHLTCMYIYKHFPQQATIQGVQNTTADGPSQAIQAITWLGWRSRSSICCLWAEPSQALWDARDCSADLGAGVKAQLLTAGQGGLSSGLLGLSLLWSTGWVPLVLWGRRLLVNPWNLIHQINHKVTLNALKLPHNHSENLWESSMSSQEQDAFQVSSSGPLTIQKDGSQMPMIGIAERSNYCDYTCVCVLHY